MPFAIPAQAGNSVTEEVTLIGFARTPRLLADRVAGDRVAELVRVVESTLSAGGTNIEQALELGSAKAKEQMLEGAQNRIILLTGDAVELGEVRGWCRALQSADPSNARIGDLVDMIKRDPLFLEIKPPSIPGSRHAHRTDQEKLPDSGLPDG